MKIQIQHLSFLDFFNLGMDWNGEHLEVGGLPEKKSSKYD